MQRMGEFEVNKIKHDWASPHYFVSEDERRLIEQHIPNFYKIVQQSIPIPHNKRNSQQHTHDDQFYDKFITLKDYVKMTLQIDYLHEIQRIGWHENFQTATGEDVIENIIQAHTSLEKMRERLVKLGVNMTSFKSGLTKIHYEEL